MDGVVSLAPPGQGGHYHVNCQPLEYWEEKFKGHGFRHMPEKEMGIRSKLLAWRNKPGIKAIYLNLACFERIE